MAFLVQILGSRLQLKVRRASALKVELEDVEPETKWKVSL